MQETHWTNKNNKTQASAPQGRGPARPDGGETLSHAEYPGRIVKPLGTMVMLHPQRAVDTGKEGYHNWRHLPSGMIIHTFEIKSNLMLISNPIRAYAYPNRQKPIKKQ